MGGATIVPRGLKTKRSKQNFQDMPNKYLYFKSYMSLLYSLLRDFPEFDPITATGMALESKFRRGDRRCGTLYFVVLMKYKKNYISVAPYWKPSLNAVAQRRAKLGGIGDYSTYSTRNSSIDIVGHRCRLVDKSALSACRCRG